MLQNSFYRIVDPGTMSDGWFKTNIFFEKEHPIFQGHFPGMPIVPGVCMLAIVKELLEAQSTRSLQLKSAANIKFLSLINPLENSNVTVAIKYSTVDDEITLDCVITFENITFFKLSRAVYQ